MNVLSLFDGISAGQYALRRLGVNIEKYYASEIDSNPIKVTQVNFPDTIQLGDVVNWREWNIDWKSIDLLLFGFPCQSFSIMKHRKGFADERGKLFFIARDILNHIRALNPEIKFLAENVPMKKEYSDLISNELGVDYIELDSADFSPQTRKRLYWCNFEIPEVVEKNRMVLDSVINSLDDFHWYDRPFEFYGEEHTTCARLITSWKYDLVKRVNSRYRKCRTLTGVSGGYQEVKVYIDGRIRKLTPIEYERLMGFHTGYSDVGLPNGIRYSILGNSWEIYTIMHILRQFSPLAKKSICK